ncbi:delta-1-pyrroline-5-carboxylate synthase A isoform X2 [Micractinium conductrix]|uniref:Delta-1-pyrroline-5-carboxylate synthase A isoform X2 n=1 Tax=Micractinium conductrix TaxID=554055 RepID=A0A2P6VRU8_9CHLO|nr:delta-1-pyrroline-5-carboxylate synthase A isoform X2 [Micractinium conductrix]|eukprot:PSC76802.1 delta-1-pyrroline-5-carboxylate synthase A isoform X2 [Micractinium conductrix]
MADEGREMAVKARAASRALQALTSADRVAILHRIADSLEAHEAEIMAENAVDVEAAGGKVSEALLQRLVLKPNKIAQLADGIRAIAKQEEPVGRLLSRLEVAEGLVLDKVTSPIGVLLIIFEARPDALPQIASLAIRSGNGLLLKGGKEASRSNALLHKLIVDAVAEVAPSVGRDLIGLVTSRDEIDHLLKLHDVIDLVIPRGSNQLVSYIQQHTKIPVLGHADGICHIYVDAAADMDKATRICVDAKVDYPAACNAVEKILVHDSLVGDQLNALLKALQDAGVTLHGGERAAGALSLPPAPSPRHEYSSLDVTIELVGGMNEAIDHIHTHGSGHTECILTEDKQAADDFLRRVDSACVFHNASTRFSDGYRFGLGAEVGISTARIHARGPVGVEGLLTTRYLMRGSGQAVEKDKGVTYTHKPLPLS